MVMIEWLGGLPESDWILISRQETTKYATAVRAKSRAFVLRPTMKRDRRWSPNGFQILDRAGLSTRLILFREFE